MSFDEFEYAVQEMRAVVSVDSVVSMHAYGFTPDDVLMSLGVYPTPWSDRREMSSREHALISFVSRLGEADWTRWSFEAVYVERCGSREVDGPGLRLRVERDGQDGTDAVIWCEGHPRKKGDPWQFLIVWAVVPRSSVASVGG